MLVPYLEAEVCILMWIMLSRLFSKSNQMKVVLFMGCLQQIPERRPGALSVWEGALSGRCMNCLSVLKFA